MEGLSYKLARKLHNKGKRVVMLRCLRGSKDFAKETEHKVFHLNVKLEESVNDLREFKSKYKDHLDRTGDSKYLLSGPCRVFHFPLLAMLEEFRPKLEKIIEDTFNELGGIQQEIALVVAFLQKYTNVPTPALLLYHAFEKYISVERGKLATYSDIKQLFPDLLMNLMIPGKPRHSETEIPPESYTFQHPLVAELILRRVYQFQKRDLFEVVERFLQFPIFQVEALLPIILDLFVYNKKGATEKLRFSFLFETLKGINADRAADVFCNAAEKLNDPVMYGNAARFCARKPSPSFAKAKELIDRAFQVQRSTSKSDYKNLCHTKGVVLHFEMTHMIESSKVKDLESLEAMASKVLEAHREARTFPPTHPHPLIGEVEVWLQCIKWIMNNVCNGDTEETLAFLTNLSPPFFRTCVSESFHLLDIVDGIVQSIPHLADPEETKRLSNQLRSSLMNSCRRRYFVRGKHNADYDIVEACNAICSSKHFTKSSLLEIKRLKAHFMLSHKESIDSLKHANREYLLNLLEDLVLKEKEYRLAHHLMKVCILVNGPQCYSLEKGIQLCEKWSVGASHECLPDYYKMVIYFVEVLDGKVLEFQPTYLQALQRSQEKSQNDMRRFHCTHFIGKEGQGMSRLISRHTLMHENNDYSNEKSHTRFWQVQSRKKLLECKGRIRVRQASVPGKPRYYIELAQGNLELYVAKNADIGREGRHFTPGALVYFTVSFNLQGPVAHGITFSPHTPSNSE